MALDEHIETFVVYMTSLSMMVICPAKKGSNSFAGY